MRKTTVFKALTILSFLMIILSSYQIETGGNIDVWETVGLSSMFSLGLSAVAYIATKLDW